MQMISMTMSFLITPTILRIVRKLGALKEGRKYRAKPPKSGVSSVENDVSVPMH